ncbi:uncharacterized protein METZ01_LOCUS228315, partial [marine metagenome]
VRVLGYLRQTGVSTSLSLSELRDKAPAHRRAPPCTPRPASGKITAYNRVVVVVWDI